MGYMITNDYSSYIQANFFQQLIQADDSKRLIEENSAIAQISSRLKQKYDVNYEFTDTLVWSYTRAYGARDRVYLDADLYLTTNLYVVNDLCLYQGYVYICTNNTTSTFVPSDWQVLGKQYAMFYGAYPSDCTLRGELNPPTLANPNAPVFNYLNVYKKGDVVWWKGNTYVCNQDTMLISGQQLINFFYIQDIPHLNVFPDDQVNNANGKYWKDETVYVITAGTLPTDTDSWVSGDNRNQIILRCMKAVVVYNLSTNISSNNVPKRWENEFDFAIEQLKCASTGDITLDLQPIQPRSGARIRFGGNIKNKNIY